MLYVFLNTKRMPVTKGPELGAVYPFISTEPKVAAGFTRRDARLFRLGRRVPSFFAWLAGWRVQRMG